MKKDTADKLTKIQELIKKKDEIDKQLEQLLNPSASVPLPDNFSLNEEILTVLKENPEKSKSAKEILSALRAKFPSVDSKKINSALVYLYGKKKHLVERAGYGMYKIASQQQSSENQN